MKLKKRVIAGILAVVMTVSSLPFSTMTVQAEEDVFLENGSGAEDVESQEQEDESNAGDSGTEDQGSESDAGDSEAENQEEESNGEGTDSGNQSDDSDEGDMESEKQGEQDDSGSTDEDDIENPDADEPAGEFTEDVADLDRKEEIPVEEDTEDMLTEEEIAAQKAMEPDYLPAIEVLELPEHYVPAANTPQLYSDIYEARYDSRDRGILSEIRNQNPWGACWAFSALGIMESSLIGQGIVNQNDIDLSERQLAYFTYNTGSDRLGNAEGDTITSSPDYYYLQAGGNIYRAAPRLMNWQGAAAESGYPYSNSYTVPSALDRESAQDDVYHMRDCYLLDTQPNDSETIENVKKLIKQYGCVAWDYYADTSDTSLSYNYNTKAYYKSVYDNNDSAAVNHAIVVVGWDDNFSKEKFNIQPTADGAWIVRNSWGSGWGDNGYFYISYEDVSLGNGNAAAVVTADTVDNYDNNYFYSNTLNYSYSGNYGKAAQVYQVKGLSSNQEQLKAVSFMIAGTNTEYKIQIYKNPSLVNGVVEDPESGEAMFAEEIMGQTSYAGVYTIDLPSPITFDAGDYMAVVIYFPNRDGFLCLDASGSSGNLTWHNETGAGESFSSSYTTSGSWTDLNSSNRSFRINLLTDDVEETAVTQPVVNGAVTQPKSFSDTYKVNLRWNKCTDVSEYEIYRAVYPDGDYSKIGSTDYSKRQYQDEIALTDYVKNYYYKIKAVFVDGTSAESEAIAVTLEENIEFQGFKLAFDGKTVELTWNTVEGAAGYEIQKKEEKEVEYATVQTIENASTTTWSDDLSEAEKGYYQYRMRAYNEAGKYTAWSPVELAVLDLKIMQVDYETLRFMCPPVEDAYWYYVWIRIGNSMYARGFQSANLSINIAEWLQDLQSKYPTRNIPDFQIGDTYSYYIEGRNSSDTVIYTSSTISFRTVPDVLKLDALELTDEGSVRLDWNGGGGADLVSIYRSETPDDSGAVYAQTAVEAGTFTDTDVQRGKTYYYWICPTVQNSKGETVAGEMTGPEEIEVPFVILNTAIQSVEAVSDTEASISWKKNDDADGYYLFRSSVNGEKGELLTDITADIAADITDGVNLNYRDDRLTAGNIYYYSITAYTQVNDEKLTGKSSAQKSVRTFPAGTRINVPVLSESGVEVKWNQTQGADGYIVERKLAGEDFAQLAEVKGGSTVTYQDTSVLYGKTYTYRVKAYNTAVDGSRQYGQVSEEKEIEITIKQHGTEEGAAYTVTFELGGHGMTLAPLTGIEAGSLIEEPDKPIEAGYHFVGWYQDKSYTKVWNFSTDTVQADITLYACWLVKDESLDLWVQEIQNQSYTGSAIKPTVLVYVADGETLVKAGKDYTITYKNNINASKLGTDRKPLEGGIKYTKGTGSAEQTISDDGFSTELPYVIIKGKGNYTGTVYKNFVIEKVDISDEDDSPAVGFTINYTAWLVYSPTKAQKPFSSIKYKKAMKAGRDYTVTLSASAMEAYIGKDENGNGIPLTKNWSSDNAGNQIPTIPKGYYGTFTMIVEGIENFDGSFEKTIIVAESKNNLVKNASIVLGSNVKNIKLDSPEELKDGITLQPAVYDSTDKNYYAVVDENGALSDTPVNAKDVFTVKLGGQYPKEGRDYKVTYQNNKAVGTATMTITGLKNMEQGAVYCVGTKNATFKITGTAFNAKNITVMTGDKNSSDSCFKSAKVYTGMSITQNKVLLTNGLDKTDENYREFEYGKDYTISYTNNLKKGKATMTFTAKPESGYSGSFKKTFQITAAELQNTVVSAADSNDNVKKIADESYQFNGTVPYTKDGAKLSGRIQLKFGNADLREGTDYTVKYQNNKAVTAKGMTGDENPIMIIKGKGNYAGELKVTFTISKATISDLTISSIPVKFNANKTDSAYEYQPKIKVMDGKKTLSISTNDNKECKVEYVNCTQEAVEKYLEALRNAEGSEGKGQDIASFRPYAEIIIKDSAFYEGNAKSPETVYLEIYETKLTKQKLSVQVSSDAAQTTYTGAQVRPDVTVSYDGIELKPDEDYTVSYGTNVTAGKNKGSITITGKSLYGGSVTYKFTILSKDVYASK